MWFLLALRNLNRNRRRTLLTLAVIAFGTTLSLVVGGMITNALGTLQLGAVAQYGNLQLASGLLWEDDNQGEETLISPETLQQLDGILAEFPQIKAFTPQLELSGMAATSDKAKVLKVLAFEPGNGALDYNELVISGAGLSSELRHPVLVGGSLARELGLQPGDFLRLTTNTIGGAWNQETLQVAGTYFRNDVNDESQLVYVPLSTGKSILSTAGVSKLAVTLHRVEDTPLVAARLQQKLDAAGLPFEVRSWDQLSVVYRQTRGLFDLLFGFLIAVITMLVFFIVFQVLSMSFFERTREVGTIRAIGTKRSQVFAMFFLESALLGAFGAALGLAAGWAASWLINGAGLSWTPPGALEPFPVKALLQWQNAWLPLAISAVATLLSAIFPSLHSAKLRIVEALRAA